MTPPGTWSPLAVKNVPDIHERFNSEEDAQESMSRLARELVDGRSSRPVKPYRLVSLWTEDRDECCDWAAGEEAPNLLPYIRWY